VNISPKITRSHRERTALIYIRQSSLAQVRDNTESTARQYALADTAVGLGWDRGDVRIIDADLGRSGRSAQGRDGYRELVAQVCLGEVGAIFGLEISRLARSTADLSRLLELARLTDTLVIDGDGVYDLTDFNDRMLLGLKGTMSEAELHLLAGRLQGAKRAAAERGELRTPLPVGYVYDDEGRCVMDPDAEVQAAIGDVFAHFAATGSAYGVVTTFKGRRFPLRAYGGAWAGQLRWGPLTHARVLGVLNNPAYAGAYVYGRYTTKRRVQPDGTVRSTITLLARPQWAVLIRGHHDGFISWDDYLAAEAKLAANRTNAGARPPREGLALCQGILACGSCGRPMSTRYHRGGRAAYECNSRLDLLNTPTCRSIAAAAIDDAITDCLLAALTPAEVALAFAAADQVEQRRSSTTRAAELAVDRARYEADRAERAFHAAEPENRLVTRNLETRWENKLSTLDQAEAALGKALDAVPPAPDRTTLETLVTDMPRLWHADTTSAKDRKRLLRTLIADVTLLPEPDREHARIGIRWHTGSSDEITVARPLPPGPAKRTPTPAAELIIRLGATTSNNDLVEMLNTAGHTTGLGRPFDIDAVQWVRHIHHIPVPKPQQAGELSVAETATRLGISADAIYCWIKTGKLDVRRTLTGRICIPWNHHVETTCRHRITESVHLKQKTTNRTTTAKEAV